MSRRKKKRELTEKEWERVFALRVRSKRGDPISDAEHAFLREAWELDPARYRAMDRDVFVRSAPLGGLLFEHSIAMMPEEKK